MIENFRPGTHGEMGPGIRAPGRGQSRTGHAAPVRVRADRTVSRPGRVSARSGNRWAGCAIVTGFPDRPPVRPESVHRRFARLAARRHRRDDGAASPQRERRRSSGKGQVVDVALYEAVFNMMESTLPEFDMFGDRARAHRQQSDRHRAVEHLSHPRRQHVVIGANGDSIFKRLMHMHRARRSRRAIPRSPTTPGARSAPTNSTR